VPRSEAFCVADTWLPGHMPSHLISACTLNVRQASQAVRLDETHSERLRPCSMSVDLSALHVSRIQTNPWSHGTPAAEPRQHLMAARQPQHNDVVHKGLCALTAAPIAVQLARARHQVLPAVSRNLLRAGPAAITQFFCSVTSTLPLRIVSFVMCTSGR
jgi:hypothetical protein